MQPFLIVKNTDLIFDLQNDCIINTNLLGWATTKRHGKMRKNMFVEELSCYNL